MNEGIVSEMQQFGTLWPQCVARAWQDTQFREALKRDPAGTLRESYQFVVPTGVDLQVVDDQEGMKAGAQQANTLRMVIPPMPDMAVGAVALIGPDSDDSRRTPFCFSITAC